MKEYRAKNREKLAQANREYTKNNKEKIAQARKDNYSPEKRKEYYENKKEENLKVNKAYRDKNHERERERAWKRHGIKDIDYNTYLKLKERQNCSCAICKKHESELTQPLHVDHDHETGEVRGLLCQSCNTALGKFGDSLEGIMKVVDYLKEPSLKEKLNCNDKVGETE